MYTGLKHLHSYTAYLTLGLLIVAILISIINLAGSKPFNKPVTLLGLIGAHVQLVFGLVIYFVSPLGFANFSGEAMGESVSRLYILEHPLTNIIAIALITIGYSRAKRAGDDQKKSRNIAIFYGIGLFLILLRIPWYAWPS